MCLTNGGLSFSSITNQKGGPSKSDYDFECTKLGYDDMQSMQKAFERKINVLTQEDERKW